MQKKITLAARILLGLIFFVFGIMGFFMPIPEDLPERLKTFNAGMMATGYFFPFLKGTEATCGALLLLGMYVPLALIVLAPIILNIFLVHAFMAPDGLVMALVVGSLEIYLAFFASPYKDTVRGIFKR